MNIDEMKKKRCQFLKKVYERSDRKVSEIVDIHQIGEELGFDRDLTLNIAQYLEEEGWIKFRTIGGKFGGITYRGIREVETKG